MFSTADAAQGRSKAFESVTLINTVTCVKFVGRFLLAGIGNILLVYDTNPPRRLCAQRKIFDRATIHGVSVNARETSVAIHGEKYVAVYTLQTGVGFKYSATSIGEDDENIIVFSGTVFREIVIWSPFKRSNNSNILHRLKKHEGVIFSITVNESKSVISSTSDDRSVVIWNVETQTEHQTTYDRWKYAKITPNYSLYAHKARVWKSIVMHSGNILSAGEDGQICLKTSTTTYQWEESRGSQVRCLDCMEHNNLIASGCTSGSIGLWSLNAVPKSDVLANYKTNNRYPKHLVVLSNADTYVLYSDGQIVFYKRNSDSHDVYQDVCLCCTLTMVKSPCETRIVLTTSNGYMIIIKIASEKCTKMFSDKISPVKIVSTIWINNDQVITCCEGNTIFLYEVVNDLKCNYSSSNLNLLDTFSFKSKMKCWITVAVKIDSLIFAGCNEGSIYLYKLNQKDPLQVFNRIHSFAGVTAMYTHEKFINSTVVSSVGRDGHHRYWNICTESQTAFQIRCEILPTKWPFSISYSNIHGLLICGFKENNLIVYSPTDQRILATSFCGGGHRAWDLAFVKNPNSIYFVCSSSNSNLESKEIPLHGQHMLLKGFHSMITNSMAQINSDLMISGSDDTTVRITRFNRDALNLLTLRSHISSVRSVACLTLKPNLFIVVTVGGRAQLKIWTLSITDNIVYCEESASHLLKSKMEKRPWRSVLPSNEGETRFMDVCVQLTKPESILISVGCSDAILRLYSYSISDKSLNLIEESLDCDNCILKIIKIRINTSDYVLTTDTKGCVKFWDLSKYIENSEINSVFTPKFKYRLHQSGINCCDWLKLENEYGFLATGGDDQCLILSAFCYKHNDMILLCNVSISIHCSQVTGVKLFKDLVITTSVDQKIIFSSWSCDFNSKTIKILPLASYFTTVADIHGLIAEKIENQIKVTVYGQGVEAFCADMNSLTPLAQTGHNVERVTPALELGEGPHWNPQTQSLYFVDLHRGKINRYHPETNGFFSATVEGYDDVTLVIPIENRNDTFVVGLGPSIGVVEWDGISNRTSKPDYVKLVDNRPGNRLNDGKADANGRLWVGSMGPEIEENPGHYHKRRGSLYSIEADGTVTKRLQNVSISNGMAWSSDNKKFYFIDTYKFAVESYDFDIATGKLSNPRVVFDLNAEKLVGDPDGMTIDADGNLWVACFNSNHILKIDPKAGKLLAEVQLPAYQITSAAFGGPNLDQLYVTTAGYQLTDAQKSKRPYSGAVFRVTGTGSTGFPGTPVKIHLCPENPLDTI